MAEQVGSIIKSHCVFFLFIILSVFVCAQIHRNKIQHDKKKKQKTISIIIYNTRLSRKSLQYLRISHQCMILLQKLTVKIEVTEVRAKISWELVNPVNLFSNYCSNSMRGVVSVYYGNVIAEAGLGLQLLFVRRYPAHCVWHSAPLLPLKWVLSLSLSFETCRGCGAHTAVLPWAGVHKT